MHHKCDIPSYGKPWAAMAEKQHAGCEGIVCVLPDTMLGEPLKILHMQYLSDAAVP